MSQNGKRRNNKGGKMRTKKEMIFPSPSTAYVIFVIFTERMRNVRREKVW